MSAHDLFWGDVSPTSYEIQRDAEVALERGDIVPALLLEDRGELQEELLSHLESIASETEKRMLLCASALEMQDVYSDQAAVCMDGSRPVMHLLAEPSSVNEVVRSNEQTACGEKYKEMFSVFRGRFREPSQKVQVCPDCRKSARAAEALGEERASVEGFDCREIAESVLARLEKKSNVNDSVVRLAVRGEAVRRGSVLLAERAAKGGDAFLIGAWGEDVQNALREKNPDYKKSFDKNWRRFFADRMISPSRGENIRAVLHAIAFSDDANRH